MDIIKMFRKKKKEKIIKIFKENIDNNAMLINSIFVNSIEDILRMYICNNICTKMGRKINGEYCSEGRVKEYHIREMANEVIEYHSDEEYINEKNIDIISEVIMEEVIVKDIYNLLEYKEINNGIILIGTFDPEMIPF